MISLLFRGCRGHGRNGAEALEPLGVYSPREQDREDEDRQNVIPDANVVTNTLMSNQGS